MVHFLLCAPVEEEVLTCPVIAVSSDDPWDPSNLRADGIKSSCQINTSPGETQETADMMSLVINAQVACTLQHKGLTNQSEKEKKSSQWDSHDLHKLHTEVLHSSSYAGHDH